MRAPVRDGAGGVRRGFRARLPPGAAGGEEGTGEMASDEMTCRAGMRVLYELAGGSRKRWAGLDEDLGMTPGTTKRVFARNDNWPQEFGAVNYKNWVSRYAMEEYSTLYGALVTIKETLRKYGAYTAEVDAIVSGVGADTGEDEIEACLDRLSDVIYATAHPASRAATRAGTIACDPGTENRRRDEREARTLAGERTEVARVVEANSRPGVAKEGGAGGENVRGERRGVGPADPHAEGAGATVSVPGTPSAFGGREGAGEAAGPAAAPASALGAPVAGDPAADGPHPAVRAVAPAESPAGDALTDAPTFADLRALLTAGPRRVVLRSYASDEDLLVELLPAELVCDLRAQGVLGRCCAGTCGPQVRDGLAAQLCSDGGLACREMLRRCERVLRAADRDAFAAGVAELEGRYGLRGAASGEPDYLAEPLGYLATRFSSEPHRRLFALVLLALLGRQDASVVLRHLDADPALCTGVL